MRRRRFWFVLLAAVLVAGGVYAYYKLSSTGYNIGLAKRGRILTGSGQPVANAWVIAKWIGYPQGVHGGPHPIVYAGVAVRTDVNGTYTLPAEWHELQHPLNQMPFDTGYYAFGLLVFAPGQELDAEKSPPCSKIGNEPPPFLCPESTKTTMEGTVGEQLADVWLKPAATSLADRAHDFAQWDGAAFIDTRSAPDLGWHGLARNAIADAQRRELTELACAETGALPYRVFFDIGATVASVEAKQRFMVAILGASAVQYGSDISCHDTIDRCPPVAADKICSALRAEVPATIADAKETAP